MIPKEKQQRESYSEKQILTMSEGKDHIQIKRSLTEGNNEYDWIAHRKLELLDALLGSDTIDGQNVKTVAILLKK